MKSLPVELVVFILELAGNFKTQRHVCRQWLVCVDTFLLRRHKIKFPVTSDLSVLQWGHQVYKFTRDDLIRNGCDLFRWLSLGGHLNELQWLCNTYQLTRDDKCFSDKCFASAAYGGTFHQKVTF